MVSKSGGFSDTAGGMVKATLYQEATAFCAKSGKTMNSLDSSSEDAGAYKYASAQITFVCT